MATQLREAKSSTGLVITWEALPDDFQLEDEPVESTGHPLVAGALRESLEIYGLILAQMLIASNFALCANVNGQPVIKAPDWLYVPFSYLKALTLIICPLNNIFILQTGKK